MHFLLAAALLGVPAAPDSKPAGTRVVFVCEHGSVKSLIAMAWFDRLAEERGLRVRASARGLTPEASVPAVILEGLERDGFALSSFEPRAFAAADLDGAVRVVAIGVDVAPVLGDSAVAVDRWEGIPAATQDYERAREALKARISALLSALTP